jgi:dihydrofolate reductase
MLSLIVATDENKLIGNNNQLPWHLPADLAHFKNLTQNNIVVMGRKTYDSLPEQYRPLPNRKNVIISRNSNLKIANCEVFSSLETMIKAFEDKAKLMIIGGMSIYEQALPLVDKIYLTTIHHKFTGDAFFPKLDDNEWNEIESIYNEADDNNKYAYTFSILERK